MITEWYIAIARIIEPVTEIIGYRLYLVSPVDKLIVYVRTLRVFTCRLNSYDTTRIVYRQLVYLSNT